MKIKFLKIIFITIIVFIVTYLTSELNQNEVENKKMSFKGETIGYITNVSFIGKNHYSNFYFYADSTRILSKADSYDIKNLNKYFKVKYDTNNPKNCILLIDEEIEFDSIKLVRAGFQKKKLYYYDNITATYKEKSEWK